MFCKSFLLFIFLFINPLTYFCNTTYFSAYPNIYVQYHDLILRVHNSIQVKYWNILCVMLHCIHYKHELILVLATINFLYDTFLASFTKLLIYSVIAASFHLLCVAVLGCLLYGTLTYLVFIVALIFGSKQTASTYSILNWRRLSSLTVRHQGRAARGLYNITITLTHWGANLFMLFPQLWSKVPKQKVLEGGRRLLLDAILRTYTKTRQFYIFLDTCLNKRSLDIKESSINIITILLLLT